MKRFRIEAVVLVLGSGILLSALLARQASVPQPSFYSTYDTGINGYRALYEVLHKEGVSETRFRQRLAFLPAGTGTLFISSFQPDVNAGASLHPLTHADIIALKHFVIAGGRLVVADPANGGASDAVIGLPASHASSPVFTGRVVLPVPLTQGVSQIVAPIRATFPFGVAKATPLLGTDHGLIGMSYPLGRGEIIAFTAPEIFSNGWLSKSDNARLAFNVLATHGPLFIDERVHGYAKDQSMWQVLPGPDRVAIWLLGIIVLLWLIGGNIRFAPPYDIAVPDERDSTAFVDGFSALICRARASRITVLAYCEEAHRRASRRSVHNASARGLLADLDRLGLVSRPTEAQILRAANLYARLRKELT